MRLRSGKVINFPELPAILRDILQADLEDFKELFEAYKSILGI